VILDSSDNLYGTLTFSLQGASGGVFELINGQSGWSVTTLYDFTSQPEYEPFGGLTFDHAGNLYGTTCCGVIQEGHGGAVVFELSPSGGTWTLTTLYSFSNSGPSGPTSTLTMDASGALYGNLYGAGAYDYGAIFKLTPSAGGWTYTSLHDFTGGADGAHPWGQVILDANGNVYGTTTAGGSTVGECYENLGCGVVFEITP
jgi:hypothetical protein